MQTIFFLFYFFIYISMSTFTAVMSTTNLFVVKSTANLREIKFSANFLPLIIVFLTVQYI